MTFTETIEQFKNPDADLLSVAALLDQAQLESNSILFGLSAVELKGVIRSAMEKSLNPAVAAVKIAKQNGEVSQDAMSEEELGKITNFGTTN